MYVSIYNNRIVAMCGHARGLRRRTGGRHERQAASADRLRAEIDGSGNQNRDVTLGAWLTRMDGRAGGYKQCRHRAA